MSLYDSRWDRFDEADEPGLDARALRLAALGDVPVGRRHVGACDRPTALGMTRNLLERVREDERRIRVWRDRNLALATTEAQRAAINAAYDAGAATRAAEIADVERRIAQLEEIATGADPQR